MNPHYTYLLINFFSIIFPLLFSFHPTLKFYKEWKRVFPALIITAAFFLTWDFFFTKWGVWSFNTHYLMGVYLFGMPVEEWMFFICIPYSCMFIYHCMNIFFKHDWFKNYITMINSTLFFFLLVLMVLYHDRMYTFTTALFLFIYFLFLLLVKFKFFGEFFRAYIISNIPFLIVNGILTALPVVMYNNRENIGVRIYTIPVEDTLYSMLMLLMNISLMEMLRRKKV